MSNERLHETIADVAYLAGAHRHYSRDSRRDIQTYITWAREFESARIVVNGDEQYPLPAGGTDNYMTAVEAFTEAKLAEAGNTDEQRALEPFGGPR